MRPSYNRVAEVARNTQGPMNAAVAEAFGVKIVQAEQLICRARKAGHEIPRKRQLVFDRAEIARVALAAEGSMTFAVAAHYDVSTSHANRLIALAREAGFVIPKRQVRMSRLDVADMRAERIAATMQLECVCGWVTGVVGGAQRLAHHTYNEHGRRPSVEERTPQQVGKVAA